MRSCSTSGMERTISMCLDCLLSENSGQGTSLGLDQLGRE